MFELSSAYRADGSDLSWLEERPCARRPRLTIIFLLFLGACLLAGAGVAFIFGTRSPEGLYVPIRDTSGDAPQMPAAPFSPASLRRLSQPAALKWNASVPLVKGASTPARVFLADLNDGPDLARSLDCLSAAIYYEAANEPLEGQRAVAQVVLNRVRHPAYPNSICGVIFEGAQRKTGCQFTFACDGSLGRPPSIGGWGRARAVAAQALAGAVFAPVGWATHYHADYVVPYWAGRMMKITTIGAHIFYRWHGPWGEGSAFSSTYSRSEPLTMWQSLPLRGEADKDAAADTQLPSLERPVLANLEGHPHAGADSLDVDEVTGDRARNGSERWILAGPTGRNRPIAQGDSNMITP